MGANIGWTVGRSGWHGWMGLLAVGLVACGGGPGGSSGAAGRSMPVDMPRPAEVVADVGGGFVTVEEFAGAAGAGGIRHDRYFFFPAMVFLGPLRVRAFVWVRCPRTGRPRRWRRPW